MFFTLNAQENIKGRKIETKFSEGWDTTPALGTIIL